MKVALYVRSATNNSEHIARQLTELRQYVERQGWAVAGVYIDAAVSGLKMSRPGLDRLLEACRQGRVQVLVVSDIARLGRSLSIVLSLFTMFTDMKITVHDIHEGAMGADINIPWLVPLKKKILRTRGCAAKTRRLSLNRKNKTGGK